MIYSPYLTSMKHFVVKDMLINHNKNFDEFLLKRSMKGTGIIKFSPGSTTLLDNDLFLYVLPLNDATNLMSYGIERYYKDS